MTPHVKSYSWPNAKSLSVQASIISGFYNWQFCGRLREGFTSLNPNQILVQLNPTLGKDLQEIMNQSIS